MQTERKEKIKKTIREAYDKIARSEANSCLPGSDTSCCDTRTFSPDEASSLMGYSSEEMTSVPDGSNLDPGCGNPVAIASIKEGETVVDLGSGGGFDCFLAARQAGRQHWPGHWCGHDSGYDLKSKK